jgi:ribosomal protein S4
VLDRTALTGRIEGPIEREDVALQINELLVVEYYARRV